MKKLKRLDLISIVPTTRPKPLEEKIQKLKRIKNGAIMLDSKCQPYLVVSRKKDKSNPKFYLFSQPFCEQCLFDLLDYFSKQTSVESEAHSDTIGEYFIIRTNSNVNGKIKKVMVPFQAIEDAQFILLAEYMQMFAEIFPKKLKEDLS